MATGRGWIVWRGSQVQQQHPPHQPSRSASDLLQSYIDRFDRTEERLAAGASAPPPSLPPPPPPPRLSPMEEDGDTLELLCGGGGRPGCERSTAASEPRVSVRTRRILRDVDRQLGHCQPCYSAPDKLDLRTMWPSMHEHLERRWRQQLRVRYEARQREEAAAAAAAKAAQGSRADMYGRTGSSRRRYQRALTAAATRMAETRIVNADDNLDVEDDDDGTEKAAESEDEVVGLSLAEAAVRSEEEEEEGGGRPWGSDSGVGLSCVAAGEAAKQPVEEPQGVLAAATAEATIDHEGDDAAAETQSFEERMRSYRCVLEAHEMSAQLRQRLEVACAVSGGPRALTADQKGRIRDRLARLQHPEPLVPGEGACDAASAAGPQTTPQDDQQQQERLTTARLTRLMNSAQGLLAKSDDRLTSCQRLCDSLAAGQRQQQQQPQPADTPADTTAITDLH